MLLADEFVDAGRNIFPTTQAIRISVSSIAGECVSRSKVRIGTV
jgi:hypothetical protein